MTYLKAAGFRTKMLLQMEIFGILKKYSLFQRIFWNMWKKTGMNVAVIEKLGASIWIKSLLLKNFLEMH